jgi:hypothetical protein
LLTTQPDLSSGVTANRNTSSGLHDVGALGVVHIPKCGGTAVCTALANAVPDSYVGPAYFDSDHFGGFDPRLPASSQSRLASPRELRVACTNHRLVMVHHSATNLMASGCRALAAIVREPRSRVLSLYRYLQVMSADERRSWGGLGISGPGAFRLLSRHLPWIPASLAHHQQRDGSSAAYSAAV